MGTKINVEGHEVLPKVKLLLAQSDHALHKAGKQPAQSCNKLEGRTDMYDSDGAEEPVERRLFKEKKMSEANTSLTEKKMKERNSKPLSQIFYHEYDNNKAMTESH